MLEHQSLAPNEKFFRFVMSEYGLFLEEKLQRSTDFRFEIPS